MDSRFKEMNKQAALYVSNSLSKLTGCDVRVEISKAEVMDLKEQSSSIDSEKIVAGIYLPISGDIKGAALLVFSRESAFTLSDLLVRRKPGTTRKLTDLDKSALKEMGNIVCGNYCTVFSDMLNVNIIEGAPSFSFDMVGAIISQINAKIVQKIERAFFIEIQFIFSPITIKGRLLFYLGADDSIINALAGI